jgi:hypothetical protein
MSGNSFYNYSGSFIPGTLGRAEAVAAEFQSVQAGFADLNTTGTDSGVTGAAYVITTPGGQPTGTLVDGDVISFKAANTNSGSATLNANGSGAVSVLRFNGTPLQGGDLTAGSWYTLTYNATYVAWTLIGATVTTFSGTISSSSPVHKVGLVAAAGVSSAAAPIDVTFAIDQTIAPTWTGLHTWNAANNSYGIALNGGSAAGQSYGLQINAGVNSSDIALDVNSKAALNLLTVYGDGGMTVGAPTGGDRGAGTINVSGALYINNVSLPTVGGTNTFSAPNVFNAGITVSGTATFSGPTTASGTLYATTISSIGTQITIAGTATFSSNARIAGSLTVAGLSAFTPSSSGIAVQINAFSGQYGLQVNGSSFAGVTLLGSGAVFLTSDYYVFQNSGSNIDGYIGLRGSNQLHMQTNGADRILIGTSGGVTINAPSDATTALTVTSPGSGAVGISFNGAGNGQTLAVNALSSSLGTPIGLTPSGSAHSVGINFANIGTNTSGGANSVAWASLGANYYGTGTAGTVTLASKPGTSSSNVQWLAVYLAGSLYWMPAVPH